MANTAAQGDPFASSIQSLGTVLELTQPIVSPITSVEDFCSDVASALNYANDVPALLTACQETLEGIGLACQALIEVPFVDVVAEVAAGIFEDAASFVAEMNEAISAVIRDVVTPCKDVFNDLAKALKDAVQIATAIATSVPDYLNTLSILSYCLDIAQDLLGCLAGTDAAQRTADFVKKMTDVRDDVEKAIAPLTDFANGIARAVKSIGDALGGAVDSIRQALERLKSDLGSFEAIVQPIRSAFDALENAIAPVKWVLDAAESVIENVLEPIVDAVLEATGIKALLDPLLDKIEAALGVKPLFDLLQENVRSSQSSDWQAGAGSAAVADGSSSWSNLTAKLRQYDSRDGGSTSQLVMDLVAAITGSGFGPPPYTLPDWPESPTVNEVASGDDPQAPLATVAMRSEAGSRAILLVGTSLDRAYPRARRRAEMASCYAALGSMLTQDRLLAAPNFVSPLWVTDVLLSKNLIKSSYDDIGLPNVSKLLQSASQAKQSLQDAQAIGPRLVRGIQAFDRSRQLPAYFQEEMQDFAALFADGSELIRFLAKFDWVPTSLLALGQEFDDQAQLARKNTDLATELKGAGDLVDGQVQKVANHQPTEQQFTESLQYIDQVAAGAAGLANALRRGLALDAKLQNKFVDRLTSIRQKIDSDAGIACQQMGEVRDGVASALVKSQALNDFLADYAAKFTQLGQVAASVSGPAMTNLSKGVQISGTIASVLDPLANLLQVTGFKSQTGLTDQEPIISGLCDTWKTFKDGMKDVVEKQGQIGAEAFEFVAQKTIPSTQIAHAIQVILDHVDDEGHVLNDAAQGLVDAFDVLKARMKPTRSFRYTHSVSFKTDPPARLGPDGTAIGGGRDVTKPIDQEVANFFVDDGFKQSVLALVNDMNAAAVNVKVNDSTGDAPA